jgi:hypothetical protein
VNPFNAEAGFTPAPSAPEDIALVEQSARVVWRAFPYFAWRFGERGRSFGRSDAGFLVTLAQRTKERAHEQVDWLTRLLAARGMPAVLMEVQLESLARLARRRRRPGAELFAATAGELRVRRLAALPAPVFAACEALCRGAAGGDGRRRGAGVLVAAAVADRVSGVGPYDDALVSWLQAAVADDAAWGAACAAAHAHALANARGA